MEKTKTGNMVVKEFLKDKGVQLSRFNNFRKGKPSHCLAVPPSFRLLFCCLNCAEWFDYHTLGVGRKLGGVAEHLIAHNEKRICQLSFEYLSLHVIERHSKKMNVELKKQMRNLKQSSTSIDEHLHSWKNVVSCAWLKQVEVE